MVTLAFTRKQYHEAVCTDLISYRAGSDVPNIADEASTESVVLARRMISRLSCAVDGSGVFPDRIAERFAELTRTFIHRSLSALGPPVLGEWIVATCDTHSSRDARRRHMAEMQRICTAHPWFRRELGRYCIIAPDIIIARRILHNDLRRLRWERPPKKGGAQSTMVAHRGTGHEYLLHAVVSCNWTVRGNRDGASSIDVLNVCHNRDGSVPRVMAVTFEPLPIRLASIVLGANGLDCLYHVALAELRETIDEIGDDDQGEVIRDLIHGGRLRDIGDLPLDLVM